MYWEQVLLPEVVQYYQYYSLEDLKRHEIRLNALYFALLELIGLKCVQKDKTDRAMNDKKAPNSN